MSAGSFETSKYESNDAYVYPIRIQPETRGLTLGGVANAPSTSAITENLPTIVSRKSRRGFGCHPRFATIKLTADGTGQTAEYKEGRTYQVPILNPTVWNGLTKGDTGTYLGIACEVVSKTPELLR